MRAETGFDAKAAAVPAAAFLAASPAFAESTDVSLYFAKKERIHVPCVRCTAPLRRTCTRIVRPFVFVCLFQIVSNLPMATSLEVTFAAYLAVLLGTLLPTLFLIVLYLNSEARKIGDFTEEGTFSD